MSDYNRKLRFGVIAEDASNITHDTAPNAHTVYIDNENHLAVKRDNYGEHWNLKESIKSKIREEYNQSVQGTIKKRYGFKLDMNEADPMSAVEYIHDAVGFTPISFTDLRSSCDYGSWYDFIKNFIGCRPVALYEDGTVYRYLQDDDYTKDLDGNTIEIELGKNIDPAGKIYNIMVEFSQKWYHIWNDENGYLYFEIANYKVDDDWCCDAFLGPDGQPKEYLYMSAYFTQKQILGGEEIFSSCRYNNRKVVHDVSNNETPWFNNNFGKMQEVFAKQNKYMYGYSQFIYFRMLMLLICKTTLIFEPTGIMDPLNSSPYQDSNLTSSIYYNVKTDVSETLFDKCEENDTSKNGLFHFDRDIDDVYKNTNNLTRFKSKQFGIDGLFVTGGVTLYGLVLAKKDIYYKPNPPYYFNNNIDQQLYNTTMKYHIEFIYSELKRYRHNPCKTLKTINNIILPGNYTEFGAFRTYSNIKFSEIINTGLDLNDDDIIGSSKLGDNVYSLIEYWYFMPNAYNNPSFFNVFSHYQYNKENYVSYYLKRFIQFS